MATRKRNRMTNETTESTENEGNNHKNKGKSTTVEIREALVDLPEEEVIEEQEETDEPPFSLQLSRNCTRWLQELDISLCLTTYQAGKILFFGTKPDGRMWVHNRNIGRCLGVTLSEDCSDLYCSSDAEIYHLRNVLSDGERMDDIMDRLYVPQTAHYTSDLDIHDMALDSSGRLLFVNTRFNCIATVSDTHSFSPLWSPPFITAMVSEDRCHLNGLALRDGRLRYVTMVSLTDTLDAWRDNRSTGGVVMDVDSGKVINEDLSMPHSPRYYRDRLWVLNSGKGEFGYIGDDGKFEAMTFCPGYLRGLDFYGNYAFIGLSMPRKNKTFSGLPLDSALRERKIGSRCGIYVVDISNGAIVHWFRIGGVITELYDVKCMAQIRSPGAISPLSDTDMQRYVSIGDAVIL